MKSRIAYALVLACLACGGPPEAAAPEESAAPVVGDEPAEPESVAQITTKPETEDAAPERRKARYAIRDGQVVKIFETGEIETGAPAPPPVAEEEPRRGPLERLLADQA